MTKLVWAFVAWTLFVWFTRLRNVFGDNTLSTGESTQGIVIAMAFLTVAASIPLVAIGAKAIFSRYICVIAVITIGWWSVRLVTNLTADESVAFKVVHVILSVVAVALSAAILAANTSRVRVPTEPDHAGSI